MDAQPNLQNIESFPSKPYEGSSTQVPEEVIVVNNKEVPAEPALPKIKEDPIENEDTRKGLAYEEARLQGKFVDNKGNIITPVSQIDNSIINGSKEVADRYLSMLSKSNTSN